MSPRKKSRERPSVTALPDVVGDRIQPPVAIVLGAPAEVVDLLTVLDTGPLTCYQMDLYQAEQLTNELTEYGLEAQVAATPDLWDLPADFRTVIYLAARGGERQLKIDMVEQSYHILRERGTLLVWSPYEIDQAFPGWLKKVYGRAIAHTADGVTTFRCTRQADRPRRRHEVTFQARNDGDPLRFLSRPGVFSFGRFDDGALALVETMHIEPGDRVLDLGCGVGTNGIVAGRRSGAAGFTAFVDSNVRAVALAELNARGNGLGHFQAIASAQGEGMSDEPYDVVLANPPYYAYSSIAQLFIQRAAELLRPGGRFYLVTKQPNQLGALVLDAFGEAEAAPSRGYTVLCATAR